VPVSAAATIGNAIVDMLSSAIQAAMRKAGDPTMLKVLF
jgi:hypothetical protein